MKENILSYEPNLAGRSFITKAAGKVKQIIQWLLPVWPDESVLKRVVSQLEHAGKRPDIILLCQPNYLAPSVNIPQWVVARTFPLSLFGYFGQMLQPSDDGFLSRLNFFWYWYRMDSKGYRLANGVLALSDSLQQALIQKGLNAHLVYPGVYSAYIPNDFLVVAPVKIITAALHLEDARKNNRWMIQSMEACNIWEGMATFTLIGSFSASFADWVKSRLHFSIHFTGMQKRVDLLKRMRGADIFIFASHQENWGYVLVEAMAYGCAVFAPRQYPFTEIIEREDYLYKPNDSIDFAIKLNSILHNRTQLEEDRKWFYSRYQRLFSTEAFSKQLRAAIGA